MLAYSLKRLLQLVVTTLGVVTLVFFTLRLIPGDPFARGYTAGMLDDKLYLIDPNAGTATSVFDFGSIQKGGWPQLMRMTQDGTRLFITMNQAGKVVMFDTSEPARPKVMRILDLGAN